MRTILLLALTSAFGVALACGGAKCDSAHCTKPTDSTAAAVDPASVAGDHTTLAIAGMKCGSCSSKIQTALLGVKGVKAATVNHDTGLASIAFDGKVTNVDALMAAIKATSDHYTVSLAPAKIN
jgi:copper chaperone CopZ